jgi:predicted PurR-regulated permease PerM
LEAWAYTLIVLGLAILLDQILDNIVVPKFFGERLGVHPAAVMVAAIVATNLIGLIGLLLAAPVLASLNLLTRYVSRKMLDLDPWPDIQVNQRNPEMPWAVLIQRSRSWWQKLNRQ